MSEYYRFLKALNGWTQVRDGLQSILEAMPGDRERGQWLNVAEYEMEKYRMLLQKMDQTEGALK